MSVHDYLSTGCLHGDMVLPDGRTGHEYCQGETGAVGAKRPASRKFCGAACRRVCHRQPRPARVRQVVPGCWEATCRRCSVTGAVRILAQVGTWGRAMRRADEHVREAHRLLTAADPEPPVGSLVRDGCGSMWVNDGCRPACWVQPDAEVHDPESWTKVAGNYGPVTVLRWGETDD